MYSHGYIHGLFVPDSRTCAKIEYAFHLRIRLAFRCSSLVSGTLRLPLGSTIYHLQWRFWLYFPQARTFRTQRRYSQFHHRCSPLILNFVKHNLQ